MKNRTAIQFVLQVMVSLAVIVSVMAYTAFAAKAFMVSPNQVLDVIRK